MKIQTKKPQLKEDPKRNGEQIRLPLQGLPERLRMMCDSAADRREWPDDGDPMSRSH
jgi:hypothetical protein